MNLFQVVITAVLATLAALVLTGVAAWSLWPSSAQASGTLAAHSGFWQQADGQNPVDHTEHCAKLSSTHLQIGEAVLTTVLDLDDAQQAALEPVADTMEKWRGQAQTACEQASLITLDDKLAGIETMLTMGAGAMSELRPAINNFYQSLTVDQQAQLQEMMQHHRQARRGRFH
ncbi:MAG: Spy/CpxP family protein refolding chaperone [Pseudomonadota bacterium]